MTLQSPSNFMKIYIQMQIRFWISSYLVQDSRALQLPQAMCASPSITLGKIVSWLSHIPKFEAWTYQFIGECANSSTFDQLDEELPEYVQNNFRKFKIRAVFWCLEYIAYVKSVYTWKVIEFNQSRRRSKFQRGTQNNLRGKPKIISTCSAILTLHCFSFSALLKLKLLNKKNMILDNKIS